MKYSWKVRVLIGFVCGCALFGCGRSSASTENHASGSLPNQQTISPIADFMAGGSDYRSRFEARLDQEIAKCLQAKGWQYEPVVVPGPNVQPTEPSALVAWSMSWSGGRSIDARLGDPHRGR